MIILCFVLFLAFESWISILNLLSPADFGGLNSRFMSRDILL